ncbi:CopY/TcrY family copper transport repressor [Aquibacillus salsiterrae]|uniref:CopY/TcrY family copper transport repressor n=1 Tax=Aquibacillus salsiterrae TaxID=2950439 RepID=A0A9X3WCK4_9BACI|nr:CopY/TcrY family copper transport repressor [Aquibacillus salsiterrae]MDC3417012.1 CopY/TcrY family copper transport repressor [Aquibacillus salsiterrae]
MEEKTNITEAEWEVMRVVWSLHQATSKEISGVLQTKKNWKEATVKTLIGRLVKKGMLNAKPDGKRYLYTATINETDSVNAVTNGLFDFICNKERGKTIANMISEATLSHDDIKLLEQTLAEKKKEAVDEVECNCAPGQCKCNSHRHGHHH